MMLARIHIKPQISPWQPQQKRPKTHGIPTNVLRLGDLPGYTGWARPAETLTGWFEILDLPAVSVNAGDYWNVSVACRHERCQQGGSLFYVRAYGRSIVSGQVHDRGNGAYDVSILFMDPGPHTVELVLTFSTPLTIDKFPVTDTEPAYEGYLLPGFPLTVHVIGDLITPPSRRCAFSDLVENTPTSAIEQGRWLVDNHQVSQLSGVGSSSSQTASQVGYQMGVNSLGFATEYQPRNCRLPTMEEIQTDLVSDKNKQHLHIVYIGDSNMRKQHQLFESLLVDVQTTYIPTNQGLLLRLPEIQQTLERLQESSVQGVKFYIIFNSGLHDIAQLCSKRWTKKRKTYLTAVDGVSCVDQYRQSLTVLVDMLQLFPAELTVFQTTTAGWQKWGNFGFSWDPSALQTLPFDISSCAHFNTIASSIMQKARIPVIDAYWLTLARPDHREVDATNSIGKHLVHAGPLVYDALLRQWVALWPTAQQMA
jgi:hypothetical protein